MLSLERFVSLLRNTWIQGRAGQGRAGDFKSQSSVDDQPSYSPNRSEFAVSRRYSM